MVTPMSAMGGDTRYLASYAMATQELLQKRDPAFLQALAEAGRRSVREHIGRR